ncbi:Hypothetical protein P9211_11511 [Prochlorococcus marinus str. MIT 9211]|uniref:Uncharacterized protein n=1 Tax=Prochlorococcus marinus (strain MIT 9211) TaxID=93059 RepID=A9BB70_PROM4|nr:Hypothetical protein P9211_11511 [Prochlorococcus marinus str. MIT 9211]
MPRYYCPFCSSDYQTITKPRKKDLICSICGEDLEKYKFIRPSQIAALFVVFSLCAPFLLYTFEVLDEKDKIYPNNINFQEYKT